MAVDTARALALSMPPWLPRLLFPLAAAAGVAALLAGAVALGHLALRDRAAAAGWAARAAAAALLCAGTLAAGRAGAPLPPAPANFVQQDFRPVVEELGPLLDRYLRAPAPPPDPAARLRDLALAREQLRILKGRLDHLAPPAANRRLVDRTVTVVNGLLLLVEREMGWILSGRWPPPPEVERQREAFSETYVDAWLGDLLAAAAG